MRGAAAGLPASPTVLLLVDFINPLDFDGADALAPSALAAAHATARLRRQATRSGVQTLYANDNYGVWRSDFKALWARCCAARGAAGAIARLMRGPSPVAGPGDVAGGDAHQLRHPRAGTALDAGARLPRRRASGAGAGARRRVPGGADPPPRGHAPAVHAVPRGDDDRGVRDRGAVGPRAHPAGRRGAAPGPGGAHHAVLPAAWSTCTAPRRPPSGPPRTRSGRGGAVVPIGRPIANTRVYVLDEAGEPAPVGVPGELYIGGAASRAATWARPGLTAERFVPDPFAAEPGRGCTARATGRAGGRTGRWSSWAASTSRSRSAASASSRARSRRGCGAPGGRRGAVVAREDAPGDTRLVAYVRGRRRPARTCCGRTCGRGCRSTWCPRAFVRLERFRSPPTASWTARRCRRRTSPPARSGTWRRARRRRRCWRRSGRRCCAWSGWACDDELLRAGRALAAGHAGGLARPARCSAWSCRCGRCSRGPRWRSWPGAWRRCAARERRRCRRWCRSERTGAAAAVVRAGAALVPRPAGAGERRLQHPRGAAAGGRAGRGGAGARAGRDRPAARGAADRLRARRTARPCR